LKVFVVRHASAGKRALWEGDDRLRPLDERGREQAEELVERLADEKFDRIVSSPYVRCVETVEPLARVRGLAVEGDEALAEGSGAEAALSRFREIGSDLVACVHGDLPEELLGSRPKKGSITPIDLER